MLHWSIHLSQLYEPISHFAPLARLGRTNLDVCPFLSPVLVSDWLLQCFNYFLTILGAMFIEQTAEWRCMSFFPNRARIGLIISTQKFFLLHQTGCLR